MTIHGSTTPFPSALLGDVMHCQVQVTESTRSFLFDHDGDQANRTREQVLKELEDIDTVLAAISPGRSSAASCPRVAWRAWTVGPGTEAAR